MKQNLQFAVDSRLESRQYDLAMAQMVFSERKTRSKKRLKIVAGFFFASSLSLALIVPSLYSTFEWYFPSFWLNSSTSTLLATIEDYAKSP
jgi:hypothetical protein